MKTFDHRGFKIEVNPYGQFETVVDGKTVVSGSLESMKKRLDKASAVPFDDRAKPETMVSVIRGRRSGPSS